jgi:hypothetical protein
MENLPTKKSPVIDTSVSPFKGFLLAAYGALAKTTRSLRITKIALISYLLVLVIIPPVFIMSAFLVFPLQTAEFFDFQTKSQLLTFSQDSNSQVLAASSPRRGSVLAAYTASVLEPQAAAAVKALRLISPKTVSEVILPVEQVSASVSMRGPAGRDGRDGETGATGADGIQGPIGPAGEVGADGADGADGEDGIDGTSGVDGQDGADAEGLSFASLSGDATADDLGFLTLKDVGTPGTYGSALLIPVITTDAQGRVVEVVDTAISGLEVSNFTSANISQWTNDSGYIVDGNTNWDNSYGFITSADDTVSGLELDGVFSSTGILTKTGVATYSTITDNSINWDTAYSHSNATTNVHGLTFTGEGAGGGLDADTVDGLQASSFLTAETDTLGTVTGRDAITSTGLTLNGGITTTTTTALNLDSGTTGAISIGTGANAKIITFGNVTGATAVNINSGTGDISFTAGPTSASGKVQIGNSATATPDLLVLDNGTADPTGVNGGMYYNTSASKFRCYENSTWKNCDSVGSDLQYVTSYKTSDTFTNITSSVTTLTTVSITPSTTTGDVMVRAGVTFVSSNNTTQPFTIAIRQTNCTGTILQTATYSIAANANADQDQHLDLNYVAVDPGASSQTYAFCASTSAGDTDVTDWNMSAIVIDTGADLAEIYTTNDTSIEIGDVVSLDPTLQTGMKKSELAYDQSVLGVVSTRPGLIMGSVDREGVKAMPVALSGRVPVKVSTENGKISVGDYLTTSETPGVAMKATEAGAIIGTAMSSYDGEDAGQILVFIKNGFSMGSTSVAGDSTKSVEKEISETESVEEEDSRTESMGLEAITETISDQIKTALSDLFKKTVEFFGSVIFHTDVTFLGRPSFNEDTVGHASIKKGDKEVKVLFKEEYNQKPAVTAGVNLAESDKDSIDNLPKYAIYDLSTKGFKIRLSQKADFDINFSWIALVAEEDNTSTSVSDTSVSDPTPPPQEAEPTLVPKSIPADLSTQVKESTETVKIEP